LYLYILLLLSLDKYLFIICYENQRYFNVFFVSLILRPKVITLQNGTLLLKFIWCYYSNAFRAFCFSSKIIKNHELHVYTQWEQQIEEAQVTTTTPDDGKTAAPLTFFFYRRHLSHVPSGKPIFSRRARVGRWCRQGGALSFVTRPQ